MSTLDLIVKQRVIDVEEAKGDTNRDIAALHKRIQAFPFPNCINLFDHLALAQSSRKTMLIAAEFKRASPSKGNIAVSAASEEEIVKPKEQAVKYAKGGAAIVSVLTEPKWFKGSLEDMEEVRLVFGEEKGRPAILRKDFILDEFQLLEARAHGADTVLLMLSILTLEKCKTLIEKAREYGMEPLVEVANEKEMLDAINVVDARVIGVNNRNLHTFTVDMDTTPRMVQIARDHGRIGPDAKNPVIIIALSGVKTRDDVIAYEKFGDIAGILVGETLMRAQDPAAEIRKLISDDEKEILLAPKSKILVKICGTRNVSDALCAAEAGAHFIGMIFVPASKRGVNVEQGREIVNAIRKFRETDSMVTLKDISGGVDEAKRVKHSASSYFGAWAESLRGATQGRSRPLLVGVFMDQPIDEVNRIAEETGIDLVQLHGGETLEEAKKCIRPVIRVIHIPATVSSVDGGDHHLLVAKEIELNAVAPIVAILLDTSVRGSGKSGGTGTTFDWGIAEKLEIPIMIAGGLTPENVREAIDKNHEFLLGVDVASGVESPTTSQQKDQTKVRAFITRALS
jgi:anthranilate synthase/indole-3-glycerol phosphate synthase/phosphoribosylanthranilate isomerase